LTNIRLFGASGTELEVLGEAVLNLCVGNQQLEVPFLVANLPRTTGILGMGFLSTKTSSLNLSSGVLTLNDESIKLYKPNLVMQIAKMEHCEASEPRTDLANEQTPKKVDKSKLSNGDRVDVEKIQSSNDTSRTRDVGTS